jgi:hypothetical protein
MNNPWAPHYPRKCDVEGGVRTCEEPGRRDLCGHHYIVQKMKAWIWVHVLRPRWNREEMVANPGEYSCRRCPMCGDLLEWDSECGWLHLGDGDADCWGALSYGKGSPLKEAVDSWMNA